MLKYIEIANPITEVRKAVVIPDNKAGTLASIFSTLKKAKPKTIPTKVPKTPKVVKPLGMD